MPKRGTVLLVDDDPDVIRGISLRFKAAGYDTITAENAEAGLSAAREHHPNAIVLDFGLPGKNGIEAMEELKLDMETSDIPIVMLSACVSMQQNALESGARFFLRKPYTGNSIVNAVQSAIGECRRSDEEPK